MTITYQVEQATDNLVNELIPLLKAHWQEIARNKDTIKLDPDYDAYHRLEQGGNLMITTARDGDELIGYIVNIIAPHIHYKNHIMSDNDILYMHPKYRGQHIFRKLLEFTLSELKKRQVEIVHMHMKVSHDFGPLLEQAGFTFIEKNFEFRL